MFCALVGAAGPILSESLRERSFGKLEGESHLRYNEVWQEDARSRDHHLFGSESPADVSARLLEFLGGMEVSYDGNSVVVVAHGDILQILQTIFAGMECNRHRDLPHLEPGELRRLN